MKTMVAVKTLCGVVVLFSGFLSAEPAQAQAVTPREYALIYQGPGVCEDETNDCSQSAAQVARLAGYTPKFVKHDAVKEDSSPAEVMRIFSRARVWIQPGGISNLAFNSMDPKLIQGIRDFVKAGGGYVGFCAGAFMATRWIGHTGGEGLGIVPGYTNLYHRGWAMAHVDWLGKERVIWFEGGPYFYNFERPEEERSPQVEVTATYINGSAAAVRTTYGKGRVWVTGLHPEAPPSWSTDDGVEDPDGDEQHLAAEMVRWAANGPFAKMPVKKPPLRRRASRG